MRHEPAAGFGLSLREDRVSGRGVAHVAVIGNAVPRRCGLATYTSDSIAALRLARPDLIVDHYAMDDGQPGLDYAPDIHLIPHHDLSAYRRAAAEINASGAELLWVQHEFGIFGGPAGEHLLTLLEAIRAPVVATLHTVLRAPNPDEDRVLRAIIARASKLIVMAEHGREILLDVYGVPAGRISVIPHGVPDRPFMAPAAGRAAIGLAEAPTLMTFGLLAPSKGIETMIEALPSLVARHPDLRYHVLGATHPAVKRDCGESYRDGLVARAQALGVGDALVLHDRFFDTEELLDWLQAADVYVTPYGNPQQVTSGALSYAVAMGRAVVSTPYVHAREILADDHGLLVPFEESAAMAAAIERLLAHPHERDALAAKAWARGQTMRWAENGANVLAIFDVEARRPVRLAHRVDPNAPLPDVDLRAVERMTDGVGMLQHGIMRVPDRKHGYCIDDNARALLLMAQLPASAETIAFATTYAAFIQHAWNDDEGLFRNFLGYDRQWLEAVGSQDSNARTLWALGVAARDMPNEPLRAWAQTTFELTGPLFERLRSPRAVAMAMLGADALLDMRPGHGLALDIMAVGTRMLVERHRDARHEGWEWFETVLAYDNARLSEALIRAGVRLRDERAVEVGLSTLRWLRDQQSGPEGDFRAVGTESFGRERQRPRAYDQQPLEAWATIDAAHAAARVEPDGGWDELATRAYAWFSGANEVGQPLASREDGGCFDGLNPEGLNLNQGAESILALQLATVAMRVRATERAIDESGARRESVGA